MRNGHGRVGCGGVADLILSLSTLAGLVAWEVTEIPKLRSGSNRGKDRGMYWGSVLVLGLDPLLHLMTGRRRDVE